MPYDQKSFEIAHHSRHVKNTEYQNDIKSPTAMSTILIDYELPLHYQLL